MSGFKVCKSLADMHLKGNFFGCMRSNCKFNIFYLFILALFIISHTSNVQRPIDCIERSAVEDRQLDETVPSVMSPCLPQWVVLSERETLFRSALDTALKNETQYKHKYLCYSS